VSFNFSVGENGEPDTNNFTSPDLLKRGLNAVESRIKTVSMH
jgi:hypothetical protein